MDVNDARVQEYLRLRREGYQCFYALKQEGVKFSYSMLLHLRNDATFKEAEDAAVGEFMDELATEAHKATLKLVKLCHWNAINKVLSRRMPELWGDSAPVNTSDGAWIFIPGAAAKDLADGAGANDEDV